MAFPGAINAAERLLSTARDIRLITTQGSTTPSPLVNFKQFYSLINVVNLKKKISVHNLKSCMEILKMVHPNA